MQLLQTSSLFTCDACETKPEEADTGGLWENGFWSDRNLSGFGKSFSRAKPEGRVFTCAVLISSSTSQPHCGCIEDDGIGIGTEDDDNGTGTLDRSGGWPEFWFLKSRLGAPSKLGSGIQPYYFWEL